MKNLFKTTLRIDLSKQEGQKALSYLRNRDKSKYHSYNDAIIAAINGFFDREQQLANEPYLETREKEDAFLQRVLETIERSMPTNPLNTLAALLQTVPANTTARGTSAIEDDLETELDFVNSL